MPMSSPVLMTPTAAWSAGMVLALLVARKGVPVTLLEAHHNPLYPSTLEALDQLGLAERLLQFSHGKLATMQFSSNGSSPPLLGSAGSGRGFLTS